MKGIRVTLAQFVFAVAFTIATAHPGFAQGGARCSIDWGKLNLNADQQGQIHNLESQWNKDYMQLQPIIVDEQRKLQQELSESRPDPLEVMALQQSIARKQEQLRAQACANYLRKRQILNETQQRQLENMIHQVLAERKRMNNYGGGQDDAGDGIQHLWRRVQTIWTNMSNDVPSQR
jgi:Spy/CpxP family protein refolding chaperone